MGEAPRLPQPPLGPPASREEFLSEYGDLMLVYGRRCEAMMKAVDVVCQELVAESKVPEISAAAWGGDGGDASEENDRPHSESKGSIPDATPPIGDPASEDGAVLSRDVKRCFVEAMERLQSTNVPKKRRGNLPKDATATFRKWFDEHQEHPYPTDEEKRILAAETGTAISQITNWFINHRKRVWKPGMAREQAENRYSPSLGRQNSM
jgi:Homeobox KN domain